MRYYLKFADIILLLQIKGSWNRAQRKQGFYPYPRARAIFPRTANNRFQRVVVYNRRDAKTFLSHGLSHNTTNNRFYRVVVLKTRRTRGAALGFVVVNSVGAFGVGARQNCPRRDRYEPVLVPMACTAGEVDFLKSRARGGNSLQFK